MKRAIAAILAIFLIILCAGCGKTYLYVEQNDIQTNYNNISANNSYFWLTEDAFYFPKAPLFDIKYYSISGDRCQKLYSAKNGAFARVQAYDGTLYTLDWVNEDIYRLSAYHTDTKERSTLLYPKNVTSYFAVGQYVYYSQDHETDTMPVRQFWVYSLEDKTEKEIAPSILSTGVMDGTPVYLVQENNDFRLYGYEPINGISELLGSFSCDIDTDEYIEDFVNFTSHQVILTLSKDAEARLFCYDIVSGQASQIHVDGCVWSLIAYEDYAFMTIIDDITKEMDDRMNAICRINLHNGEMEEITQLQGIIDTYVASDDYVFVRQYSDNDAVYRYDCTGEKELVCKQ